MLYNLKNADSCEDFWNGCLVKAERSFLSSWGRARMPWLLNTAVIDQGEQLNPGFPCSFYVVLLGLLVCLFCCCFLSSSQFKKTVLLPSTLHSVVSLLDKFCLWSPFQGLNSSLAECLFLPCVPLSSRSDCLVLLTCFFPHSHVLSLARFARHGILFPPAY